MKLHPQLVLMRRISNYIIIFSFVMIFSCSQENSEKQLIRVETFKERHAISTPLAIGDSWVQYIEPIIIEDSVRLNYIQSLIVILDESNHEFYDPGLKLRSILQYDDGSESILEFDLRTIKVDGNNYKDLLLLRILLAGGKVEH